MLSRRQSTYLKKIEQAFDNDNLIVHLHGPSGGGKSTLVNEYIKNINSDYEDWSVYYIEGKKNTAEAYTTITLSEEIHRPKIDLSSFRISLGFKISGLFSLGVSGNFRNKIELDKKVSFVIDELRRNTKTNILIVADSFQYWDTSSQSFLFMLKNYHKKLLGQKNLKLLLVTDDDKKSSEYIDLNTLYADGIELIFSLPTKTDLREALLLLGYSTLKLKDSDLDIIMSITGGHLDLVKLFIEGYFYSVQGKLSTDTSLLDVMKMLEYRLERFGDKKNDLSDLLQVSSILQGDFKTEHIRYLLKDREDIDKLLADSCDNDLLKQSNHFIFSNVFIQELFYEKLKQSGKSYKFEIDYAKYLKDREPENYMGRAYYLSVGDKGNEHVYEIIGLLVLAYCRNIESTSGDAESNRIQTLIINTVENCKNKVEVRTQYNIFLSLRNACELYYQEKYEEANDELLRIPLLGSMLLVSEIKRMKLVNALMLNMNTHNVKQLATQLYDSLNELKSHEKEQWCKSAFTLFSTYSNKLDDYEKSISIADELLSFIRLNYHNSLFQYMGHVIYRKACLFEHAANSHHLSKNSVAYFEHSKDYMQYYLTLCNHSGNLLVVGEYDQSISHLEGCLELIMKYPSYQFPSQEKIYNNLILAKFLKDYRNKNILNEIVLHTAINEFEKKSTDIPRESNAILNINLINLYSMKGDYSSSYNLLNTLKQKILIDNEDSFYAYHISNINLALSILQQSWDNAEKFLEELKNNFPNFHRKNEKHILSRNQALTTLVKSKIILKPDQLDEWVYNNSNRSDAAGKFYCRLFLFSDLQFTSI